ncbi:uncharacterized protein LOC116160016 [Photinus pyralis]|uniref:uncharacterized protein LOC116160016 n=1 Tax=Photinus pyralis TaxID=7054 RepID=UPI00126779D5|nr:uncharacterized protein LOC116160016 [Photinus pyralis]
MVHHPKKRFVMEELQVSSRTFVDGSSFCREVCMDYLTRRSVLLGGEGVTVEIDERKYNRGRRIEGQWIFGGYERGSGNVFIVPVLDRTTDTLLKLIRPVLRECPPPFSEPARFLAAVSPVAFTRGHRGRLARPLLPPTSTSREIFRLMALEFVQPFLAPFRRFLPLPC